MDANAFQSYLTRGGRSESAVKRCLAFVADYEQYLKDKRGGKGPGDADHTDLEAFVAWVEREPKASAKTHLWAIGYYYDHTSEPGMRHLARALREQRIRRAPFNLSKFQGVDPDHVQRLAQAGIRNVAQMLEAGSTRRDREALAARAGIPYDTVLELVKLSDLARIPGIKGIRARLYHDAGVDTVEKLAGWEPEALRAMLVAFVDRTRFDGIAPLPKEAAFSVAAARRLSRIVEY